METFIPTKEDLEQIVSTSLEELLSKRLPLLIRKATRKEWLNTNDVMKLTGWSKRTIQHLRDNKRIKFFQEGHRILYRYDDIEAYLESIGVEPRKRVTD